MIRKGKSVELESRLMVTWSAGWGTGSECEWAGHPESHWGDGNLLKLVCSDGCTTLTT